jgi:glucosamine--fructose-6-phosphate aminotransferase (isomerizing)
MTKTLDDILRQPQELLSILERLTSGDRAKVEAAARHIRHGRPIYVVGIGSSWNAALAVVALLLQARHIAFAADASELLHFAELPSDALVIALSRSGRSVEVVRLLDKIEKAGADLVAITNTPESPLAQRAGIVIDIAAALDHNVSITMYSGLALAAGLVAAQSLDQDLNALHDELAKSLEHADKALGGWRETLRASDWLSAEPHATYLMARGPSLASCNEARLLWEEVAKAPATALPTGGFRHGSQEVIHPGSRVCIWLDQKALRKEDQNLIADLRTAGAKVMAIGNRIAGCGADVTIEVPSAPAGWQFLVDGIPMQLASELLAQLRGEDADLFRFCAYVIEDESGISGRVAAA